jgi:hypothetical protein
VKDEERNVRPGDLRAQSLLARFLADHLAEFMARVFGECARQGEPLTERQRERSSLPLRDPASVGAALAFVRLKAIRDTSNEELPVFLAKPLRCEQRRDDRVDL